MLHSLKQRLRLQHHPFAAAERPVIHGTMPVLREHAQILHVHFNNPRLSRAPQNPVIQRPRKKIRKNRYQIKSHLCHSREVISRERTLDQMQQPSTSKKTVIPSEGISLPLSFVGNNATRAYSKFKSRKPSGSITSMRRAIASIRLQISSASG